MKYPLPERVTAALFVNGVGEFYDSTSRSGRKSFGPFVIPNVRVQKTVPVTEFDIDIEDEEVQGQYTRDFMTTMFAHPSVTGFMMWGFWEGRHWKPKGAMFRRDWSLKPNARAYYDLVFGEWWTDVRGRTGADGAYSVRGFKGDYEVEVSAQGRTAKSRMTLDWRGAPLKISLP